MKTNKSQNIYQPSQEVLDKYADVLINFALNSGKGVNPNEVVQIGVPDVAKPLALSLYKVTLEAGAHPMLRLTPTEFDPYFYNLANENQLNFFPKKFLKSRADLLDHSVGIIADVNPEELKDIDSEKIMKHRAVQYPYREWLFSKEHQGKFSWTAALWGTQAKADVVGLTYEEYWQQIIQACYLDLDNPVNAWRDLLSKQVKIKNWLDDLVIEWLEIKGEGIDLKVKIGPERVWRTGSGANIPSFEHFTSPDWRGTEGYIEFNQPLYRYGNIVDGIRLEFKKGRVTKATAKLGENVLQAMIKTKNADKIGEFSLTDKRFSRITHPMAETLFDENIGGPEGNMHIAVGMAYKDCYRGDPATLKTSDWNKLGYNNSSVHTDMVSTTKRKVTAILQDGSKVVIYENGSFTCDL